MFANSIHVIAWINTSFPFKVEYSTVYNMPYIFIHSSVNKHLGYFYFLAIVNNAAMKIGVQTSVQVPAFNFYGDIPESRIVRSHCNSVFYLLRNHQTVLHSSCTI